jgi:hypothetical protein
VAVLPASRKQKKTTLTSWSAANPSNSAVDMPLGSAPVPATEPNFMLDR